MRIATKSVAMVALVSLACGSSANRCLELAQMYADEVPNVLICDPSDPDPCAASRNAVDYEQDGSQLTLDGLSQCTHSVNAARTAKLDSILSAYQSAGCVFLPSPICTTPKDRCVEGADGGAFTCFP